MSGIKDRVAVIGMGCSKFGERWDSSSSDLIVEAAYEAFEDAGIESKDVRPGRLAGHRGVVPDRPAPGRSA